MKVKVTNFQSLGETEVEVEGLTVLVGPSHRGKSALIRAIEGALFNRPGDAYVRAGAKECKVEIEGLPGLDKQPHSVVWTKGKTAKYVVDGETFSKVGTLAPPPLIAQGYRDLWIGDKDRKAGEYLRPQVATQFDPLFLLTRPGSLLADVLHYITRIRVLTLAQDRCAAQLRSVTQQIGVKEAARAAACARVQALEGTADLQTRVAALVADDAALTTRKRTFGRLLTLRDIRARLLTVASSLPEPATVRLDVITRLARLLALAVQRPVLKAVGGIWPDTSVRTQLLTKLNEAHALAAAAAKLLVRQRTAIQTIKIRESAARGCDAEVLQSQVELDTAFADVTLCPLCEQVVDHVHPVEPSVQSA